MFALYINKRIFSRLKETNPCTYWPKKNCLPCQEDETFVGLSQTLWNAMILCVIQCSWNKGLVDGGRDKGWTVDLTSGSSELCYAQGIRKPYVARWGGMQFCLWNDLLFFPACMNIGKRKPRAVSALGNSWDTVSNRTESFSQIKMCQQVESYGQINRVWCFLSLS